MKNHPDPSQKFGDVAARYAELRPAYPPEIFAFLMERLEGPRGRAVDLGAGSGQASEGLVRHFAHVSAVEPDARMLAHFAAPVAEKINLPAEKADFAAGSIDAVVAATSFHWMEQDAICAHVARWLRPGGVFFPFLYGPFIVHGPARAVYEAHWRLWAPFMDKRLGAKADYSRSIGASGAFCKIETFSGGTRTRLNAPDAAALFGTTSYARSYAAHRGDEDAYLQALTEEIAAVASEVEIEFPLGGVLAVRKSD